MEVILKRTKITKAIFSQIQVASLKSIKTNIILGYCIIKGEKWVLLYDEEEKNIKKYPQIYQVKFEVSPDGKQFTTVVYFSANYISRRYVFDSIEACRNATDLISLLKDSFFSKGQIYL